MRFLPLNAHKLMGDSAKFFLYLCVRTTGLPGLTGNKYWGVLGREYDEFLTFSLHHQWEGWVWSSSILDNKILFLGLGINIPDCPGYALSVLGG